MKTLELSVNAVAPDANTMCPVSGGVPFPRGELAAGDGLRLLDAAGQPAPLQTQVLATWDPEGREVKWLLVDFQLPGGAPAQSHWRPEYGPDVPLPPSGPSINPETTAWPPSRILSGLSMTDQSGTVFSPERTDAVVETAGPLRTVLRVQSWYADAGGDQLCRLILRLHYYAGLDRVRVFHSFIMDADPEEVQIRSLALTLNGFGGKALVAGEQSANAVLPAEGSVTVFQDSDQHFAITGSVQAEGRRNGTWLCAEGDGAPAACFLRNGWEEFPKRISRNGDELCVELWPEDGCPPVDLGRIADHTIMPDSEEQLRTELKDNPGAFMYSPLAAAIAVCLGLLLAGSAMAEELPPVKRAGIEPSNGVPRLVINGQPTLPIVFFHNTDIPGEKSDRYLQEQVALARDAGVHIYSLPLRSPREPDGVTPKYSHPDSLMDKFLAVDPEARFILRVYPGPNWSWKEIREKAIPEGEFVRLVEGKSPGLSIASQWFRWGSNEELAALVRHYEEGPYSGHIIAWQPGGPYHEMFMAGYRRHGPDYSEANTRAFRAWLRERYADDAALREA